MVTDPYGLGLTFKSERDMYQSFGYDYTAENGVKYNLPFSNEPFIDRQSDDPGFISPTPEIPIDPYVPIDRQPEIPVQPYLPVDPQPFNPPEPSGAGNNNFKVGAIGNMQGSTSFYRVNKSSSDGFQIFDNNNNLILDVNVVLEPGATAYDYYVTDVRSNTQIDDYYDIWGGRYDNPFVPDRFVGSSFLGRYNHYSFGNLQNLIDVSTDPDELAKWAIVISIMNATQLPVHLAQYLSGLTVEAVNNYNDQNPDNPVVPGGLPSSLPMDEPPITTNVNQNFVKINPIGDIPLTPQNNDPIIPIVHDPYGLGLTFISERAMYESFGYDYTPENGLKYGLPYTGATPLNPSLPTNGGTINPSPNGDNGGIYQPPQNGGTGGVNQMPQPGASGNSNVQIGNFSIDKKTLLIGGALILFLLVSRK